MLGRVLRALDVLAGRTGALDRHRDEPRAAAGEEQLGRGGDDRPARRRRTGAAAAGAAARALARAARVAGERRGEMLDEVDLVDVAARDRGAHRLDRLCVALVVPGPLPLASSYPTVRRAPAPLGADPAGEERQRAGLGLAPVRARRSGAERP